MKKMVVVLLLIATLVVTLAACTETFTCDGCREEVTSTKHEIELLGVKEYYCDDCYKQYEAAEDALGDLADMFG